MAIVHDVIHNLSGHPMSGLWELRFESGVAALVSSGHGVRQLARCYGAVEGSGDLLEKIVGQEIYFSVDGFGVLEWFQPAAHWSGPDLPLGIPFDEDDIPRYQN